LAGHHSGLYRIRRFSGQKKLPPKRAPFALQKCLTTCPEIYVLNSAAFIRSETCESATLGFQPKTRRSTLRTFRNPANYP